MLSLKTIPQTCCLMSLTPSTPVLVKMMKEITISHHIGWLRKITSETTISQILIYKVNILSPITFSRATWSPPIQRLQLHFYKMQYPRHFFIRFPHHSHTKYNVHMICLWGLRVIPHKMQYRRNFLWGPSVVHINGEFHVKVALLALLAHHLLSWGLHVLHVSVSRDHGKSCFMWCH